MNLMRTWTGHSEKSRPSIDSQRPVEHVLGTTTDEWVGHYNRLTESQRSALESFKTVLQEHNLYTPEPQSHDDPTLIRYLRARKFDVNGALAQFKETEEMRKENMIDQLYDEIDVDFYEQARILYPQWTGHRDRRGLPLYVYQIKHLDSKTVHSYTKETAEWKKNSKWAKAPASSKLLPLYALYENMLSLILPLCSTLDRPAMDVPITQGTNIVDVSGVGIKTFWNLKTHMQEASQMATAHFPETLDRIFIIGAPYFFPTVWGWIKRWFDPNTVSKIFVLSQHDMKPTLEKFFELSSIPKAYGGTLEWEYGQLPAMDEAVRARVGHDWYRGPSRWEGQMVPVGTIAGKPRERPEPISVETNLPETELPPKYDASSLVEEKPKDALEVDAVASGIAGVTVNGAKDTTDAASSIETSAATETAPVAVSKTIDEPTVTKLPINIIEATEKALNDQEVKAEEQTNGVAKPPLERFETAAELLESSS